MAGFVQPGKCQNCKKLWAIIAGRTEYKAGFIDGIIDKDTALEALKGARDLFKLMMVDETEEVLVIRLIHHLELAIEKLGGN